MSSKQLSYLTISKSGQHEIVIKKSRFICSLARTKTVEEAQTFIEQISKKYHDATHNTYAYTLGLNDNQVKASDNGEPSGTAGIPELKALQLMKLKDVTAVVTRYFGGIKLGCGGLTRAYSNSCIEALAKSTKIELINGYNIYIYTYYDKVNVIDRILENSEILSKEFGNNVVYNTKVDKNILDILDNMNIDYKIINECIIKRLT